MEIIGETFGKIWIMNALFWAYRHGRTTAINTSRAIRSRRHFADDSFKCIFLNDNVLISIKISLKFIPMGPINNIPVLVQIMALHQSGDKPLSEPKIILLTQICVTRPQWVNTRTAAISCKIFWHTIEGILSILICVEKELVGPGMNIEPKFCPRWGR